MTPEEKRRMKDLIERRSRWVEANRENDFEDGIKSLLTELYPDNAHFIYELLQNAEDAGATKVNFILNNESVEFRHNGGRLFSFEDVDSITSIGKSVKRDDPTSIGKFGVGFKSVFAYTDTPEIVSGHFHFRIKDMVVPDIGSENLMLSVGKKETCFLLPFNNSKKSAEKACEETDKNLRMLDEGALLFLSKIQEIKYCLPDSTSGFIKRKKISETRFEIAVKHPEESKPISSFFLYFENNVKIDDESRIKDCRIAVAFGLEKTKREKKKGQQKLIDEWEVKSLEPGQVCIYFPAEKETSNLRFHLHAPFASTVARDSVRDSEQNDELRDHLAELIAKSMATIRNQGLLTVGFLATLPNEEDSLPKFYKPIMERLVEQFKKEKLTPMKQGGHAVASNVFRGLKQLSDLIDDQTLARILDKETSNSMWIANPPQGNQREDKFLSLHSITKWTSGDLLEKLPKDSDLAPEWLKEKSDEWHQNLYVLLGDSCHDIKMENYRIVRLSNEEYSIGKDCYFPDADIEHDEQMPRVTKEVYTAGNNQDRMEKAKKFLKRIGVREVGEKERIEAMLNRNYTNKNLKPKINDIKLFIDFLEKYPSEKSLFRDYFIFKLAHGKWGQSRDVYLDSPFYETGLSAYYKHEKNSQTSPWALSADYENCKIDLEKIAAFAKNVGARTELEPRKTTIPWDHPESDRLKQRYGNENYNTIDKDYNLQEFDELLRDPNLEKSRLIWDTMSGLANHDEYLQAVYRMNLSHSCQYGKSTFVHKLKDGKWVPQKQNNREYIFEKPADAVVELLPGGFSFETGAKWLDAVEFGKRKRLEIERNSAEFQRDKEAAQRFGCSPDKIKEFVELMKKDPDGFERWKNENRKPDFPTRKSEDPNRRKQRLKERLRKAPKKIIEGKEKLVRTTQDKSQAREYLKNFYTNQNGELICQLCNETMPFKKKNKEYYFETVQLLANLEQEMDENYLALCPTCAAKFNEYVVATQQLDVLPEKLASLNDLELPLEFDREGCIKFVGVHLDDIKAILEVEKE